MRLKYFAGIFLVCLCFVFGSSQVQAASFDEIKEKTNITFIQIWEQVELFFTFKNEGKVNLLEEQAQRRIEWAQSEFEAGDDEQGQKYLERYSTIKEKITVRLGDLDEGVLEEFKTKTIEENNIIETMKGTATNEVKTVIEENQINVLEKTWEVVGDIQGDGKAENFVKTVYAPGTGPGGTNKLVIEGGALKYAPGTSAGGESSPDIKTNVVEKSTDSGGESEGVVVD